MPAPFAALLALLLFASAGSLPAQQPGSAPAAPEPFPNGLPQDPAFFPIGVWLQAPANAARYRELGINLYVGLWQGPTRAQLEALEKAGMRTICAQNETGLRWPGRTIAGWLHGDEPDNAQAAAIGYGPPIAPRVVVADYERMRAADPTRPVLLNLGQGAAWDGWHGRGVRTNHPEDYPEYCKGADLVSFDIYPVTHDKPAVRGKLEFVGRGVQRLVGWTQAKKPGETAATRTRGRPRPRCAARSGSRSRAALRAWSTSRTSSSRSSSRPGSSRIRRSPRRCWPSTRRCARWRRS